MFDQLKKKQAERRELRKQQLRKKNFELRQAGKDPLKGWHKMVDTGMSGSCMRGAVVIVDITGKNLETYNFFSEAQKQLAYEVNRSNLSHQETGK